LIFDLNLIGEKMKLINKTKIIFVTILSLFVMNNFVLGQNVWDGGANIPTTTNGNVGIGTTSPDAKLHVQADVANNALQVYNTNSLGYGAIIRAGANNNSVWALRVQGNNGGNEGLYVSSSGNVGIGTTSPEPGAKLEVNGDIYLSKGVNRTISIPAINNPGVVGYSLTIKAGSNSDLAGIGGDLYLNGGNGGLNGSPGNVILANNGGAVITGGSVSMGGPLDVSGNIKANNGSVLFGTNGSLDLRASGNNMRIENWNNDSDISFHVRPVGTMTEVLTIKGNTGNVGIGTTNPDPAYKLSVNGTIRAKEIKVNTNWSDFVFEDNYKLMPLSEVEEFVKKNKHLPDIPSEKEVKKNGVSVGEMQSKLLQKIEELTLYVIDQNKKMDKLEKENELLRKKNDSLEKRVIALEK
jgi:hypothetical protein